MYVTNLTSWRIPEVGVLLHSLFCIFSPHEMAPKAACLGAHLHGVLSFQIKASHVSNMSTIIAHYPYADRDVDDSSRRNLT